jgi:hypothetical protein
MRAVKSPTYVVGHVLLEVLPPHSGGMCCSWEADAGAVDPKTWKKYLWPMMYSLADLEVEVVSNFLFVLLQCIMFLTYPFCQIN